MDFNQVRYFLALAETLNFTRAAEQCHVTQPALTQSIKRLEEELGGPLLHRDRRHTRLTELGRSLRSHFEQIDQTRRLVKTTARSVTCGEMQELNIGLMCTIGPRLLSRFLAHFQERHPTVMLLLHDVTPARIACLLLTGALDGVFCARHGAREPRLRYTSLFEERMVVAFPAGHAFAEAESVSLREIARQRYVDRLHCEFRETFMRICADERINLDIAFRSEREDWIQTVIRDGGGVSLVPEYSLLPPALDHRPISDPGMTRQVELATADSSGSGPALAALVEMAAGYDWTG